MRYLDTGSRDPDQALASWIQGLNPEEIEELRVQSGFFGLGGIGLFLPILERHSKSDKITKILIGSNDGGTLRSDVLGLASYLGVPRENALLGVVSFGNAYFHPKTYHVRRNDGSQAAYVGSANLSAAGLALHVEAGVSLDMRDDDEESHLNAIAEAVDAWFDEGREGLHSISDIESVEALVGSQVLSGAPKPKPKPKPKTAEKGEPKAAKANLKRIVSLPAVQTVESLPADEPATEEYGDDDADTSAGVATAPPAEAKGEAKKLASLKSVPKTGFPPYLLFEPGATGPTSGSSAMSGASLPGGATGLIVQLNLDSARHFMGAKGTANISIPVAAINTIRFGTYGVHSRPRAEFSLKIRFIADDKTILSDEGGTNVQGYGYTPTESGHADIRMLVPASVRAFGDEIGKAGSTVPGNGDFALLEWPTTEHPEFRLTFLEPGSKLALAAGEAFAAAINTDEVVGHGACWLQEGLSPEW